MRGVIAHTKFFVSQFMGFGLLTPRNLAIPMNALTTAVLHCDGPKVLHCYVAMPGGLNLCHAYLYCRSNNGLL